MDVARLNFSHGTRADHGRRLSAVRTVARETGRHLAVLQDLQGPKIRLGRFVGERTILSEGRPFTITTKAVQGTESRASTTYERLPR
jgi:pyruvate kinase